MATELPMSGFDSYAIWITERATDILRGDVPLKGGITPMSRPRTAEASAGNMKSITARTVNNVRACMSPWRSRIASSTSGFCQG